MQFLADRGLKRELRAKWQKFRPAEVAREALKISPGGSKKSLVKLVKAAVVEEVNSSCLDHLRSFERQGQLSRCTSPSCAHIWSRVVWTLPEEQLKFGINAAVDVLPHNANLCLWKKKGKSILSPLPQKPVPPTSPQQLPCGEGCLEVQCTARLDPEFNLRYCSLAHPINIFSHC